MEVQILSRKLIKPVAQTPDHLRTYKLTFFDQLAPPAHVPFVFFYSATDDDHMANINIHQQLERSLAETLTRFYPLAGRYVKDDLLVDCNDQGVAYLEAQVNRKLAEFFSELGPAEIELLNHFVPWDIGAATLVTSPMVGIQATMFECGGLALAVHSSHVIVDGYTVSKFMHAWATASRRVVMTRTRSTDQVMSFNLASVFPARDDLLSRLVKKPPNPMNNTTAKIVTRRFLFDEKTISTLKTKVMESGGPPPSKVKVVTAFIWKALINVARAKHGHLRPSILCFSVGLHGKTGVAVPENSLGNLYISVPIKFMAADDDDDDEMDELVGLLGDTIENTLADCSKISRGDDIFAMVINNVNEIGEAMYDEKTDVRLFTSMSRFPLYEADFGCGKPCRVTSVSVPFELVGLLDTKCGTGIEALVSLNELDMLRFQRDPDILSLQF